MMEGYVRLPRERQGPYLVKYKDLSGVTLLRKSTRLYSCGNARVSLQYASIEPDDAEYSISGGILPKHGEWMDGGSTIYLPTAIEAFELIKAGAFEGSKPS